MKKKISIYFIGFLLLNTLAALSQDQEVNSGTLKLLIKGFSNDKGHAMIALCNSKEDYKNDENNFRVAKVQIKDGKVEVVFRDLPFGIYAVKVYHDENGNNKLDTGLFGIPKEKYGFSNNVRAKFGVPKFDAAKFEIKSRELELNIKVMDY